LEYRRASDVKTLTLASPGIPTEGFQKTPNPGMTVGLGLSRKRRPTIQNVNDTLEVQQ
jgi:hypothetical protein